MVTAKIRAYREVRSRIFSGKYSRGEQLKEEELANSLGISRTPVRQAIQRLADQGLVEVRANHRTYVADVNETQFEEMFDIIAMLESYSVKLAASKITDEEIDKLQALNNEIEDVVTNEPENLSKFLDINAEFHKTLHAASGNDKLNDLIMRVIEFPHNLFIRFNQINAKHNPKSLDEHQEVINALRHKDAEMASLAMKLHTEAVRRSFRELWQEDNKDSSG